MASTISPDPSNYMQTLTRYLSNIMNSTLLGLPREIKELIYFDALSHAAEKILVRPASRTQKHSVNGKTNFITGHPVITGRQAHQLQRSCSPCL
jgi:exocyst complex component 6